MGSIPIARSIFYSVATLYSFRANGCGTTSLCDQCGRRVNRPFPRARVRWLFILNLLAGLSFGQANDGWEGHIFSAQWENDAIANSDRHYTQGARLSYLTSDNSTPGWTRRLSRGIASLGFNTLAEKLGFELAQEMHTPQDLQSRAVVEDDQPYAGWLYGSLILQRRGETLRRGFPVKETIRLDLGVIGPEALAEETQKVWHSDDPEGWDNQLKTEPGVVLRYRREYLFKRRDVDGGWDIVLIPHLAGRAGNVAAYANAGATTRFGFNLPNEFAVGTTPARFGFYFFAGLDGRVVLRNIFLEGNTFRSSHRVDKNLLVGSYQIGLTLVLKKVEVRLGHTFLTREFEKQKSSDSYGSATVAVKF